ALDVAKALLDVQATLIDFQAAPPAGSGLPADACSAFTNSAANFQQRAQALAVCAARRQVAQYGLDGASGTIVNSNLFNSLSEAQIDLVARLLGAIEADFTAAGLDVEQQFIVFLGPLLSRQRQLLLSELAKTNSLTRTFEIASLLTENFFHRDQAGLPDV